jgi:DNA adenine methylase
MFFFVNIKEMTMYHGGKQRIGKEISKIISEKVSEMDREIVGYCEPFCGMLGVYQHIPKLFENMDMTYKAGDMNESVCMMWGAVQTGWVPPGSCSQEKYNELQNDRASSAQKGYIGHQFSFGGQYFVGFIGKYKGGQTFFKTVPAKICKIAEELIDVEFSYGSYTQFSDLDNYIIYCDPPYVNTRCKYAEKFDSESFWDWVREMSKTNVIFVSEYSAPDDFECVFENKKTNVSNGRKASGREKLFIKI